MKKEISIYLKPKESFLLSVSRDAMTYGFMLLCMYVGRDSNFWTFVTGSLFLIVTVGLFYSSYKENTTIFESKQKAIEYINRQKLED